MITVYVIESIENGKRYVGITNNLGRRLREHRSKQTKGSEILGKFKLIYKEEHDDYASAREREKFLKSGTGKDFLNQVCPRLRSTSGG